MAHLQSFLFSWCRTPWPRVISLRSLTVLFCLTATSAVFIWHLSSAQLPPLSSHFSAPQLQRTMSDFTSHMSNTRYRLGVGHFPAVVGACSVNIGSETKSGSKKCVRDPFNYKDDNDNDTNNIKRASGSWFGKKGIKIGKRIEGSSRPRAAIISLVRNEELEGIMQSMRQLEYRWNRKYAYPWIFFNERPFSEEFKVGLRRTPGDNDASLFFLVRLLDQICPSCCD